MNSIFLAAAHDVQLEPVDTGTGRLVNFRFHRQKPAPFNLGGAKHRIRPRMLMRTLLQVILFA